jgi:DNA-binding NtrC family response regulator
MLERLNYRVLTAIHGRQALEIYGRRQDEIALVLTDVTMPELGGIALAQALCEQNPAVKVVAMTGYPLGPEARARLAQNTTTWVQKPLSLRQLAQTINQALA